MKRFLLLAITAICLLFSCTSTLQTNRRQFIKDTAPTVRLDEYRSVQEREGQNHEIAIAMAISGGGSRAYNFGIGVLLGLEEVAFDNSNLLQEVDYFSTVSGGGFAAGGYLAGLFEYYQHPVPGDFSLAKYYERTLKSQLAQSYVTPIVASWFNPRNWVSYLDDGDALERAIDFNVLGLRHRRYQYGWRKTRSIRLGDIFINRFDTVSQVKYPMLVANGTIFNNMTIFPFAPNIVDTFQITGYTHHFRNFFQKGPIDPYSLPLSVGIKASGSFPAAITNTTLVSNYDSVFKYLHIIDGGIADNIGYQTAIDLLRQDTIAKTKILLVVDADGGGIIPTFSKRKGGYLGVQVFSKLPSSGLDARHNLLRLELEDRCSQNKIIPVFLSFGNLIENNPVQPPDEIEIYTERIRLESMLKLAPELISDKDLQILYELVTQVKTKYSILPVEQNLLNLTGKKVVAMKKNELMELLGIHAANGLKDRK